MYLNLDIHIYILWIYIYYEYIYIHYIVYHSTAPTKSFKIRWFLRCLHLSVHGKLTSAARWTGEQQITGFCLKHLDHTLGSLPCFGFQGGDENLIYYAYYQAIYHGQMILDDFGLIKLLSWPSQDWEIHVHHFKIVLAIIFFRTNLSHRSAARSWQK